MLCATWVKSDSKATLFLIPEQIRWGGNHQTLAWAWDRLERSAVRQSCMQIPLRSSSDGVSWPLDPRMTYAIVHHAPLQRIRDAGVQEQGPGIDGQHLDSLSFIRWAEPHSVIHSLSRATVWGSFLPPQAWRDWNDLSHQESPPAEKPGSQNWDPVRKPGPGTRPKPRGYKQSTMAGVG